jgi:hypothetical protein
VTARGPVRFGPRPALYVWTVVGLGLVVFPFAVGGDAGVFRRALLAVFLSLPFLYVCAEGWVWYTLDDEGIRSVGFLGRRFVPWDVVHEIRGRSTYGSGEGSARFVFQSVRDAHGRKLLRLTPWTLHRRDLSRRIRLEIRARRADRTDATS